MGALMMVLYYGRWETLPLGQGMFRPSSLASLILIWIVIFWPSWLGLLLPNRLRLARFWPTRDDPLR
jgi:hypothetical protein